MSRNLLFYVRPGPDGSPVSAQWIKDVSTLDEAMTYCTISPTCAYDVDTRDWNEPVVVYHGMELVKSVDNKMREAQEITLITRYCVGHRKVPTHTATQDNPYAALVVDMITTMPRPFFFVYCNEQALPLLRKIFGDLLEQALTSEVV